MTTIQIAVDAPFCTKKEFLKRTGISSSVLDRSIAEGDIPILPKAAGKTLVLINLVKLYQRAAEQQV